MKFFSRAWDFVKKTAANAKELAEKHIVITGLSVGGLVGILSYFALHFVNSFAVGNSILFTISSVFGVFAGLTAAAFSYIAIALGAIVALAMILYVKNQKINNLEQGKAASDALIQQLQDEYEKLKAERTVDEALIIASERAVENQSVDFRRALDRVNKRVDTLDARQAEDDLKKQEDINKLAQAPLNPQQTAGVVQLITNHFSNPAVIAQLEAALEKSRAKPNGAGAVPPVADLAAAAASIITAVDVGDAANDSPNENINGATQRRDRGNRFH